jgi:hypothetical protein
LTKACRTFPLTVSGETPTAVTSDYKKYSSCLILFGRLNSNSSFGFKLTEVDKVNEKPSKG